jgi:cyanobactin maturation PatA/PatG family protease
MNGVAAPANPHDTRQMVSHLEQNPSEAQSLIWTLNLELTPLYAIEASGPFAAEILGTLRALLAGEILSSQDDDYIERVSIPGRKTGRSVRLFSGQVVPVIELDTTRGLYGWKTNWLVKTAVEHVQVGKGPEADVDATLTSLVGFLNKVYFDMRNLGVLSRDRALNFAATNAFQAALAFSDALTTGMQLDSIDVEPSPYARSDADAWDIKLKFFDPENLRRARIVYRFTVDVSEIMPVTLGEVRSWPTSY